MFFFQITYIKTHCAAGLVALMQKTSVIIGSSAAYILLALTKQRLQLQCVSKKNIPDIFSCNFRKHCRIFI